MIQGIIEGILEGDLTDGSSEFSSLRLKQGGQHFINALVRIYSVVLS